MVHLDRIAALLAKAERSEHPAEAEAYLAKAQQLATQASVDLAVARARTARRERRARPISRTVPIGEPGRRANPHLVSLYVTVAGTNDVQVDVARNSTYVIGYGMPADLDVVAAMFGSLATQMATAATAWLATGRWRDDTYLARVRHPWRGWLLEPRPHTSQTARTAFYRAFIERIGVRLRAARQAAEERAAQRIVPVTREQLAATGTDGSPPAGPDDAAPVTGALVLQAKQAEVRAFYQSQSRARGAWGGYGGAVVGGSAAATRAGREAAARARLATPPGLPAAGRSLPREPGGAGSDGQRTPGG